MQNVTLSALETVKAFFDRTASAEDVKHIAELVSEDVDWYVAGDLARVPWIGRKHGRAGAAEFYAQIRQHIISEKFEVKDFLDNGHRVVVIGALASRVAATGKLIESEFAFDFTVRAGQITRFRLFEDSFAVSAACTAA